MPLERRHEVQGLTITGYGPALKDVAILTRDPFLREHLPAGFERDRHAWRHGAARNEGGMISRKGAEAQSQGRKNRGVRGRVREPPEQATGGWHPCDSFRVLRKASTPATRWGHASPHAEGLISRRGAKPRQKEEDALGGIDIPVCRHGAAMNKEWTVPLLRLEAMLEDWGATSRPAGLYVREI